MLLYYVDFDNEVPSMADIQASLLNESDEDVITPLCQTMLLAALDDPGVEGPCVSESKLLNLIHLLHVCIVCM